MLIRIFQLFHMLTSGVGDDSKRRKKKRKKKKRKKKKRKKEKKKRGGGGGDFGLCGKDKLRVTPRTLLKC